MAKKVRVELDSDDMGNKAVIDLALDSGQAWTIVKEQEWLKKGGTWVKTVNPAGISLQVAGKSIGYLKSIVPATAKVGDIGSGGANDATFDWKVLQLIQ